MKLVDIHVDGFGRLVDRHVHFHPTFNVVVGDNEAGKSTLSSTILALLYGLGRGEKDRWRPWSGARFAARLTYELADGRAFEVQREFERDSKGVRVYDEHGNDASGECSVGKTISPGEAHLNLPLEVFTNASFVAQGDTLIDGFRAERITYSLARALDGGPREDAAMGALARLDEALAHYVGRKRATVNAPLRRLRDEISEAEVTAAEMRNRLRALDDLRARLDHERARAVELDLAVQRHEMLARALRAATLRARLESLREVRDELAALAVERARFDDVDRFPSHVVDQLETHYREWHTGQALSQARGEEAQRARMTPALAAEFEERNSDGGALDDEGFAALAAAAAAAVAARDRATAAADRAQNARRNIQGGHEVFGAAATAGAIAAVAAIVFTLLNQWVAAGAAAVAGAILLSFAGYRWNRGRASSRVADAMQREADVATANERAAAENVAHYLAPLGVASVDELGRRRDRALELRARKREAARLAAIAAETRAATNASGAAFDAIAVRLVAPSGSRSRDLAAIKELEARKRTRDGLDVRLSMIDVRRGDLLGNDDEFALEAELAELTAAGVDASSAPEGTSARAFEAELSALRRRAGEAQRAVASLDAQLSATQGHVGDLAAHDERVATLQERLRGLEQFETAIELARSIIEARTKEAHQKFARRLSDYASDGFSDVTGLRYVDVRVDPTTLGVRVRTPENDAVVDLDRLSAGTREQAYFVTRLAMARMFSEGLEAAPLLLDDPFAYWDDARIERSLPILGSFARSGTQLTIFTTSDALARAASSHGASIIRLTDGDASNVRRHVPA